MSSGDISRGCGCWQDRPRGWRHGRALQSSSAIASHGELGGPGKDRQCRGESEAVRSFPIPSCCLHADQLRRNSKLQYLAYPYSLTPQNAVQTMEGYDFILDCTDRPSSRYLISDAAVLATKPLITASALRTEGQLMVLNNPPKSPNNEGGSCYRCVFPKPPPAETVMTCGDGGILGPVVGVMGVLMAMETLKLLLPTPQRAWNEPGKLANANPPSLLLYSAYGSPPFRSVKLRGKKKGCPSCSDTATLTRAELSEGALDYDFFCGLKTPAQTSNHEPRISAAEYSEVSASPDNPHILVDVREKVQFDICHLKGSVNLPFSEISRDEEASISQLDGTINSDSKIADRASLYFICRYGNDSQVAVKKFKEAHTKYDIKGDIAGGLRAWRESVDPDFPEY